MSASIPVFDWIIPDQLGACVNAAYAADLGRVLRERQIGRLVNLHERADDQRLLEAIGADGVHLPVRDFTPPSQEQLHTGVAAIREGLATGKRVAVHCGAGLGRTGTLLAAYLVAEGATAEEAMARVRAARPGSIETREQEQAVEQFATTTLTR